jgi:hypothetical protein
MVLDHPSVTAQTKSLVLRSIFQTEEIEIELLDTSKTVIYVKDARKEQVWQATVDLDSEGIRAVYAFGNSKEEVLQQCLHYLKEDGSRPPMKK